MDKRRSHAGAGLETIPLTLALLGAVLPSVGCDLIYELLLPPETFSPFGEFPDAVLEVPVIHNTEESSSGATARDINGSGG